MNTRFASGLARLALGLALLIAPAGCSKKNDSGGTAPTTSSGTLSGVVSQAGASAIAGASVKTSAGGSTTTDGTGHFSISIPANQDVRVDVTKAGFTLNQQIVRLTPNQAAGVTVALLAEGATQSVTVSAGGAVTDPNSNAKISLPPDFVTASGPVSVTITGLDPTGAQIEALPGGLEAVDGSGATKYLKPVSFAEYTVKDAAGNTLQYNAAAAAGADIELPIPASLVGQPGYANGDPIECYVYDPADGKWKTPVPGVIGPSSVDGEPAIKATIFHLSWYGGAPASDEIACVSGTVTDGQGHPVAGVHVEAYPGGSTTTDAQGHYQVQAAANSSVRVVASKPGTGTTFWVDTKTVTTGGTGAPCATADFALVQTEGVYSAIALINKEEDLSSIYLDLTIGAAGGEDGTPVAGATVKLADGTTTWTIPEYQPGLYFLNSTMQTTPALNLAPGRTHTLTIDYDGNGTVDATGQCQLVGQLITTNPTEGSNQPASYTATWTDEASTVPGYAPTYIASNYKTGGTEVGLYVTTSRQYVIGNGVVDPITNLPNPALTAGSWQFNVAAGSGPFAEIYNTPGVPLAPNITGPATSGYFYSYQYADPVNYTVGASAKNGVQASLPPGVKPRTGITLRIDPAKVRAVAAKVNAQAAARATGGGGR